MNYIKSLSLLILCLICFNTVEAEIIDENTETLMYKMLGKKGFDKNSLNFLKDWAKDTDFKLDKVVEILNNPMQYPEFIANLDRQIESKATTQQIVFYLNVLDKDFNKPEVEREFENYAIAINKKTDIFNFVEKVWRESENYYRQVFSELNDIEKEKLEYFAYTLYAEPVDSLQYKDFLHKRGIKEYEDMKIEEIIPILAKLNLVELWKCFYCNYIGFEILHTLLAQKSFDWTQKITKETRWGKFCLGSIDDENYEEKYSFILEPGGNENYQFPINTDFEHPFYWIIDYSGDDYYKTNEIGSLFTAFFGLGMHADYRGDDLYMGQDLSFASFLGLQSSLDKTGDDIYRTGLYSNAAATFGLSLITNYKGNDYYSVTESGEGFGGCYGLGILTDYQGNDTYYAGGKYLHAPLAPFDYRSLSQGFGYGIRPYLGGGIGILYDGSGNDNFDAGVYAQAVAYWYGLGILIDKKGNDFYNAVYYPQGSGIHLAGGFLYDAAGEDHYYSKHGPGQGAGHDYAVGFLIDKSGNDFYAVEGGNGLGLTNSVGIFIDDSGNDNYAGQYEKNYGFANQARESGGIGIFLDTGGKDTYAAPEKGNNLEWANGYYGFGLDTLMIPNKNPVSEKSIEIAKEIDSTAAIAKIFNIASDWGVGSKKDRVNKAREILLARDKETANYIYEKKLGTKRGLTYRTIMRYAKKSNHFRPFLIKALEHSDSLWIKNSIALIGSIKDTTLLPELSEFLQKQKYVPAVLSAVGKFKTEKATKILAGFINHESERIRVITARGLKTINSDESRTILLKMRNDSSYLIQVMVKTLE